MSSPAAFNSVVRRLAPISISRSFSVAPALRASSQHNNDPKVLDKEKADQLKGNQDKASTPLDKTAPEWNEKLASESEAAVKGEKSEKKTFEQLQVETIEKISKISKE